MKTDDIEHGIMWARGGLIFGVTMSIAGNVANAVLTHSDIHVALRIPGAVGWPLALFVGIEVMVRNRHRRSALAYIGRGLLLSVSVTTFITSFINLNGFMTKAGEPALAAVTGPLGIDGLMLGCTIMLLAASIAAPVSEDAPAPAAPIVSETAPVATEADVWTMADAMKWSEQAAPVSPAPVSAPTVSEPRAPRSKATTEQEREGVLLLMEGKTVAEVGEKVSVSRATAGRWGTVLRLLLADRTAVIDPKHKVRPELVSFIREQIGKA